MKYYLKAIGDSNCLKPDEDFNISFNMGTIRRGYSELDEKTANIIIKAINKNN